MRTFYLNRINDISGVSGRGMVAQGVIFDDGTVALRWLTSCRSTSLFSCLDDVVEIHGHGENTKIVFY